MKKTTPFAFALGVFIGITVANLLRNRRQSSKTECLDDTMDLFTIILWEIGRATSIFTLKLIIEKIQRGDLKLTDAPAEFCRLYPGVCMEE